MRFFQLHNKQFCHFERSLAAQSRNPSGVRMDSSTRVPITNRDPDRHRDENSVGMTVGMLLCAAWFLVAPSAWAKVEQPLIRNSAYQGELVSQSVGDGAVLAPGETKSVTFTFKNTGKKTWLAKGVQRVSAYTISPSYHASQLAGKQWLKPDRPAVMSAVVKPGKLGRLGIVVVAPKKVGEYREDFYLAAENETWIKGTHFYITIRVVSAVATTKPIIKQPVATASTTLSMAVGPTLTVVSTSIARVVVSSTAIVSSSEGISEETTGLSASSTEEAGFWDDLSLQTRLLQEEPMIRVNLFNTSDVVRWQSSFAYQVMSGTSTLLTLSPDTSAQVQYGKGVYQLTADQVVVTSTVPLRLVPTDSNSWWSLPGYERTIAGRKNLNFNSYRGSLIVAYSTKSDQLMVIEEVPIEQYLAGVTESSDGVPIEYAKALQVAARSYAWQHIPAVGKPRPVFDVYATTADQLYLGYNVEASQPHIVQATQATAGQLVTYQGTPVVTPYFGHSNGTTRSWSAAWGGTDKPWLVPVECVYDKGMTRWGHGVGMSAHDALVRAGNDGWKYDQILGYYYTATRVEKIY